MKQKILERNYDDAFFQIFHMYRGTSEHDTLRMKYYTLKQWEGRGRGEIVIT
jgi:hypothetical protein